MFHQAGELHSANMEQLVQCPVCTLYLHNGMSLESHLDTHPKDQVIKALCSLANKSGSSYGSRTSTPLHSERSYRSRSRTPATEDRWTSSHRGSDNDRYWRRTPSRASKSSQILTNSRIGTPDPRIGDINYENNITNSVPYGVGPPYSIKNDKHQSTYPGIPTLSEFDQQYAYYQDSPEDREIKYSRSAEYSSLDSSSTVFTHTMPVASSGVKLQTTLVPAPSRGNETIVKVLPKPNNILVKTNVGGVQYITPGVKPMHVMVPTTPTFVQKNVQNNMIMTSSIPGTQMVDSKAVPPPLSTNQFNQMTSSTFTPGTTVVQNSQIIYREMVHNIDGKRFISCVPSVLSRENVTNVSQGTSMYQNVMVLDQLGNASCMYTTPPQVVTKPCTSSIYGDNITHIPSSTTAHVEKTMPNTNDCNKTLIIEVGPIVPPTSETALASTSSITTQTNINKTDKSDKRDKLEKSETPGPSKGLKILSNIKVEVPVQHNKNMLNTVMDLTGPNESEYVERPITPEKILPDLDENNDNIDNSQILSDDCTQPSISSSDSIVSHTFSVIKNVGNPPSYKESKSSVMDSKIETEFSDSCPVPDLICNEKPSISPCSELSENGENSIDHTSISPSSSHNNQQVNVDNTFEKKTLQPKTYRHNALRLNNIFVKKHKKILQIKNVKTFPVTNSSIQSETEPRASSSSCRSPENYSITKLNHTENNEIQEKLSTLNTISVEQITILNDDDHHGFDADTEEQSMDIEPVASSSSLHDKLTTSVEVVQVKEEANTSNEDGFSNNENSLTNRGSMTPLETLRPINVITYGNMAPGDFDDDSNHRELLELEASSKNKQFVSMMNENYFGDNIYADYFTPERESLDSERAGFSKEGPKDGMYIWGESSHKESEFVLPNFIHESYKIADSNGIDYSDVGNRSGHLEGDRDSKTDVLSEGQSEPPLNICADERMPPRGELSGQESNGDMESSWSGIYQDIPPAEPYDLIARESWVSDGSEMDPNEKRDNLDEELYPKVRGNACAHCGAKFASAKELRAHKSSSHPLSEPAEKTYSRMLTARAIKKEEKPDETALQAAASMMPIDSKESIATTMLQVYDAMSEAKPKIEGEIIKQEPKQRRRRDYVCPTCKVDQLTDAAFHAHLKIHPLECLTCGKCFFRRANLALHIKTHLGIKNFKCEVCEKRFITKQKLMEHHNIHTGRTPVKCTICDETFRRYSNMLQHRDRHHFQKKPKVRDFVCQCGAVFQSRAKLQWHRETHEPRPRACPYCSDKFVHAASLTRHVRRTHNVYYLADKQKGKAENVPCPVCKQIYLRTNLRAHLLTHSGSRAHVCVICSKAFTTKWNLKLHRWTHMTRSYKPYRCTLCKGAFIRHAEYVAHMNAHRAVRPYTCNYCGCQFIRKYNCQRHVREHENDKKYVCKVPECGKSFHRSYYLSEHMKVHSGVRPFSCHICGKTSSNKSNHNKHLKIHHAREPVATEA
ncbi:unnamed protein product [Diatraea saccharalis]|uniref:C2H2-type domain-containing protein n=1 Tax=Diatraea saccharalis TaxID=40085 RepID=A0A9N9WCI2_9NEOP|nr:unnamed protein product [Diatraea saccharalis]